MATIHNIDLPKKGITTYMMASDWHTNSVCQSTLKILIDYARQFPKKDRKLIIPGDFLDANHLMARNPDYKKWKALAAGMEMYFVPESEAEFEWGNDILDELQKVFSEILFMLGNHDQRYYYFQKANELSEYNHNFDMIKRLNLEKRGIRSFDYPDWLMFGNDLGITHGSYHGASAAKRHFEAGGPRTIIHGHLHKIQTTPFPRIDRTYHVHSMPCISTLNPVYIKNNIQNWSTGFSKLSIRDDGKFWYNVYETSDGEMYDSPKLYKV